MANQGIVELENKNLDILNWLLEKEGNPNAEINFKRVVKLIAEYRTEHLPKLGMFESCKNGLRVETQRRVNAETILKNIIDENNSDITKSNLMDALNHFKEYQTK